MNESKIRSWTPPLLACCALVFLLVQVRTAFVERILLRAQVEASRSLVAGLDEEIAQLQAAKATREEQLERAVVLEKRYASVLDELVKASRTDAEAWAVTQKWKIQPTGGQPVPPPPGAPAPPPGQVRGAAKPPQPQSPSLSTPFILPPKPLR